MDDEAVLEEPVVIEASVVPLTTDEEALLEALVAVEQQTASASAAALAASQSAVGRLIGLGIPEAEARVIVGYTGPLDPP